MVVLKKVSFEAKISRTEEVPLHNNYTVNSLTTIQVRINKNT